MATTMQVGDIIAVTIKGRANGQTTLNVLHYKLTSVGSLTAHPTWAAAFITLINNAALGLTNWYMECCSEDLIDGEIWVQKVYPTRMAKVTGVAVPSEGAVAELSLPPATSVSLTKRGAIATRASIGGVRMPAVPVTWNEAGYVSAVGITKYDALNIQLAAPLTNGSIGNLQPVIFNAEFPGLSIDVAQCITQETIRIMKRRVVGRGI